MKYAILTFGCRTNQADSFDVERNLRAAGGEESSVERADLVVVNTCSVTAMAEQAARQAIRRVRRLNPTARIMATGCYAVRQPRDLGAVGAAVHPRGFAAAHVVRTGTDAAPVPGPGTRGRTMYLLRAQTGCNEHCAYCIVPATRGPSRSTPLADLFAQVGQAAEAGFKEVTLTGVHLGSYGRDLDPRTTLAALLRALGDHPAPVRFRLSAVEPMDFGEDVVGGLSGDRFARHFHLPLQHASDRILSAMARPYTIARYRDVLSALLARFSDAAIGADLIVGFPGETEADHRRCVEYVASSPLAYLHVFPFSPRPGTSAAERGGRPPGDHVRRRVEELRRIGMQLNRRFRARFIGAVREGLTLEGGTLVMTDNYLRVRIPPGFGRNERVRVRITSDGEPMEGIVAD